MSNQQLFWFWQTEPNERQDGLASGCGTAKLGPVYVGTATASESGSRLLSSSGRGALVNRNTRLAVQVLVV